MPNLGSMAAGNPAAAVAIVVQGDFWLSAGFLYQNYT